MLRMTALGERVADMQIVTTDIHLAHYSTVTATKLGVRKVAWYIKSEVKTVSLSKTLVLRDIKTSLLSVPALFDKNIAVLFVAS